MTTTDDFHDIAIDSKAAPFGSSIVIDGQRLRGVESVTVRLGTNKLPRVSVTLLPKSLTLRGRVIGSWSYRVRRAIIAIWHKLKRNAADAEKHPPAISQK
jgi:hypothetical protein